MKFVIVFKILVKRSHFRCFIINMYLPISNQKAKLKYILKNSLSIYYYFSAVDLQTQQTTTNDQNQDSEGGCMC